MAWAAKECVGEIVSVVAVTVASLLGCVALIPLFVVDGVFLIETFLGLVKPRQTVLPVGPRPSIAMLMPAHDEAATLAAAGAMLHRLVAGGTRVVVVADNCSDDTAAVAQAAGCEVVVRCDPGLRGKGYALSAGRDYLAGKPPDIVVVLDADCSIDEPSLDLLARRAMACDCAVQAAYLFRHDARAPSNVQISNFAFLVKNLVRQRGARRLGAAAILTGSAMAFPWATIATLDLATDNLVEDLSLGIALVRRQQAPVFEEAATVWSDASNPAGTATQRSRWEHGFLTTAGQFALPLLVTGARQRDFRQFWLGAHLLVPPLSIVLTCNLIAVLLGAALAVLASAPVPGVLAATLLLLVALAVICAWVSDGRQTMHARVFAQIPGYLAWKIAIYARLITGRQPAAWTRTERIHRD
jgi:cellulose synthase/poly-beta-1,6-N-acetylglucosamine synthase-like glycosyltransferase